MEARDAESICSLRESNFLMLSIVMPGLFAGFVSTPYPDESDRMPALVALSPFARFDEHAALAAASATVPMSFSHCIVALPLPSAGYARFDSVPMKQAVCCDVSREPAECVSLGRFSRFRSSVCRS